MTGARQMKINKEIGRIDAEQDSLVPCAPFCVGHNRGYLTGVVFQSSQNKTYSRLLSFWPRLSHSVGTLGGRMTKA